MNIKGRTLLYLAVISAVTVSAADTPTDLKAIMQDLQTDTQKVTAGLLVDDLAAVAAAAASIADHPRIPPEQVTLVAAELGTEMPAFKQFDMQVHELSLSIASAARDGDRARAITDFHRMLNGCLDCHAAYRTRVSEALSAGTTD
jgi:hypothetical protein